MAWVTISLRKMALKARISNFEYQLMKLSQDKMSMQMAAGYATSVMNVYKNNALDRVAQNYLNTVQGFDQNSANYSAQVQNAGLLRQRSEMVATSLFQAMEDGQLRANKNKEQQIDQEMEIIQTQLKAARAEEENLEKAMDEDIKKTAIKLM